MNVRDPDISSLLWRLLPWRSEHRLKNIHKLGISLPGVEILLWVAAASYQIIARLVRFAPEYDHTLLMVVAMTSLRGMGFGEEAALSGDLAQSYTQLMRFWPIGWSILIMPFLACLKDPYWAMFGTEALGIVVFFAAMAAIVYRVGTSMSGITRLILIFALGFIIPPHGYYQFTNLWAVGLFAAACALVLPGEKGPPKVAACLLAGILAGCTVWMRYQFAFSALAILLVLLVEDHRSAGGRLRILAHAGGLAVILGLFYYWRFHYVPGGSGLDGGASAMATTDPRVVPNGFYPFNLLRTPKIAMIALLGDSHRTIFDELPEWLARILIMTSNPVLVLGAVSGAAVALFTTTPEVSQEYRVLRRFYAIAGVSVGLNLLLLGYLSIIKPIELTQWVFIGVSRYHAIGGIFLAIALAQLFSVKRPYSLLPIKVFVLLLLVFFSVERLPKVPANIEKFREGRYGPPIENGFYYGPDLTRYLREAQSPDARNVFVYFGPNYIDYFFLAAQARLLGYAADRPGRGVKVATSRPVSVVFALPRRREPADEALFQSFCAEVGGEISSVPVAKLCTGMLYPESRRK